MTTALIQGSCRPLVVRRSQELELGLVRSGWSVVRLSGSDPSGLDAAAAGSVFFGEARNAYFVRDPESAPAAVASLVGTASDDKDTLVVVVLEGRPKAAFKKTVTPLFKGGLVETFDAPGKPWEMDAWAADLAVREAERLGTPMSDTLATSLVARVGPDPGTVIWEVLKAHRTASADHARRVEPRHVASAIAPVAELGPSKLLDALAEKHPVPILAAARLVGSRSTKDPTMWAVGVITPTVIKWLAEANHMGPVAGANIHAWRNHVVPPARRWGAAGCSRILSALAEAESAVKSGASSPWNLLTCGLVSATEDGGVLVR
jgi:hypothetical protein